MNSFTIYLRYDSDRDIFFFQDERLDRSYRLGGVPLSTNLIGDNTGILLANLQNYLNSQAAVLINLEDQMVVVTSLVPGKFRMVGSNLEEFLNSSSPLYQVKFLTIPEGYTSNNEYMIFPEVRSFNPSSRDRLIELKNSNLPFKDYGRLERVILKTDLPADNEFAIVVFTKPINTYLSLLSDFYLMK